MLITLGKYFFSEQEKLGLGRIRTGDLWVTSPSLYQLSYQPDGIFEPLGVLNNTPWGVI